MIGAALRVAEIVRAEREDDGRDGQLRGLPDGVACGLARTVEGPGVALLRVEAAVRPVGAPVVHDALAGLGEHAVVGIEQARELRGKCHGSVLDVGVILAAFLAVIAEARRDGVADEFEPQERGLPRGSLDRVSL